MQQPLTTQPPTGTATIAVGVVIVLVRHGSGQSVPHGTQVSASTQALVVSDTFVQHVFNITKLTIAGRHNQTPCLGVGGGHRQHHQPLEWQ